MHAIGQFFPRGDRSPAIVPISEKALRERIDASARFSRWQVSRSQRVAHGFYTSQAFELRRREEVA
jgi:magnesium-protoporphyrin O-methyltransferase